MLLFFRARSLADADGRRLLPIIGALARPFSSRATDPYSVLGLRPGASEADIKAAFRRAALKHHPDRNPDNRADAEAAFKRASDAYSTLTGKGSSSGGAAREAPGGGSGFKPGGDFSRWEHQRQFEEMLRQMQGGRGDFGNNSGSGGGGGGYSQSVQVRRTVVTRPDGTHAIRTETITTDGRGRQNTRVDEQPVDTPGMEQMFGQFMAGGPGGAGGARQRPAQPKGFFGRILQTLAERALRAVVMATLRRLLGSAFPPRGPLK